MISSGQSFRIQMITENSGHAARFSHALQLPADGAVLFHQYSKLRSIRHTGLFGSHSRQMFSLGFRSSSVRDRSPVKFSETDESKRLRSLAEPFGLNDLHPHALDQVLQANLYAEFAFLISQQSLICNSLKRYWMFPRGFWRSFDHKPNVHLGHPKISCHWIVCTKRGAVAPNLR